MPLGKWERRKHAHVLTHAVCHRARAKHATSTVPSGARPRRGSLGVLPNGCRGRTHMNAAAWVCGRPRRSERHHFRRSRRPPFLGGSSRDRTCEGTSWGGCPPRPSWPPRSRSRRCQGGLMLAVGKSLRRSVDKFARKAVVHKTTSAANHRQSVSAHLCRPTVYFRPPAATPRLTAPDFPTRRLPSYLPSR